VRADERIGAVVLAAGESRRLGRAKLLLPFGASTVIGCVVGALEAAGLEPVAVVAGGELEGLARALCSTRAKLVGNRDPSRGMLSSLRAGLSALPPGAFVVALGDQPRLRARDIRRLVARWRRSRRGIAIATHQGKRGHPVLLDSGYRDRILALSDNQTLRDLIHSQAEDVVEVECASDAVIRDIDTQEDYEAELRRARAEA